MNLRAKSSLIVAIILLASLSTLYIISSRVISQGFGDLEVVDTRDHVQRAINALETELAELDSKTSDWAAKDEAYNFIAGTNPGYIQSNFDPATLRNLRVHLAVFTDINGRILTALSFDENGLPNQPPATLEQALAENGLLTLPGRPKDGLRGYIHTGGSTILLSVYPVTANHRGTLSNGYLIFGRNLDQAEIQRLAAVTGLLPEVHSIDSASLPEDFVEVRPALARETISVRPLDEKTVAGYGLLQDISGNPRLILRVQLLRGIYAQARNTLNLFLAIMIAIGLLFFILGSALLENLIKSQRSSLETIGRYQAVVEQMSDGMIQVDAETKTILEANDAFARLLAYDPAVLIGMSLLEISDQMADELDRDYELTNGGRRQVGERRYQRSDGQLIDVDVSTSRISYGGREVLCILARDITTRKMAENALRESEERYQLATRGANDGLWDWNLKTNRIYYSDRWKSMLGRSEVEIGDSPDDWFRLVQPEDLPQLKSQLNSHLQGGCEHFQSEHRILHKSGSYRWVLSRGMAVFSPEGTAYRLAGSMTDITESKQSEEQLRYDAFHDGLTNLPNRALFLDRLSQAIERSRRRQDYLFALLFLDLDRFKVINDSLGHTTGDQILINAARRLENCLRSMDTIARLGGDEFVILVEYIESSNDALRVAERIQESLRPPFIVDSHEIFISASIGIVLGSIGYEHAEDALRDADIAMYRSKALGRARYEVFNPTLRSLAMARMELETDLRRALERREFAVHYQPILSLDDNRITGFEALIRWRHPTLGDIQPVDFIPVAEETGLIIPIGLWVMEEACRQMKTWQDAYPSSPRLTVSVNMSGKQFSQNDLPSEIERVLHKTGLDITCLRLEITESVVMEAVETTTNMLKQLKAMGMQLEIDDFGTGYSSLSYLQQLPIDAVKIDRSFISQMNQDGNNQGIVQAIVAMAHNLGMHVIAEGVEINEQLDRLKDMQCESAQGFLFHRPMDSDAISTLLNERIIT